MIIKLTIDIIATLGLLILLFLCGVGIHFEWQKQNHNMDSQYLMITLVFLFSLIAIWN